MLRKRIKNGIRHTGLAATKTIRELIDVRRRQGWPYCSIDQGDFLFLLTRREPDLNALEIGFATGSTALYILSALNSGRLTSIDYAQDRYEREGEVLIRDSGFSSSHELIEENSIKVLPELYKSGRDFNLIFIDGWKTFDHIWVDTFYCSRMLRRGGYIVFDDAGMPAVRKCISILKNYYRFEPINTYQLIGGVKQRMWHILSARSILRPYGALQKAVDIATTEAGRKYDFWKRF